MNNNQAEKPKRGGARPGTGRKPLTPEQREAQKKSQVRVSMDISADEHERLKALAAAAGVTPRKWLTRVVLEAIAARAGTE